MDGSQPSTRAWPPSTKTSRSSSKPADRRPTYGGMLPAMALASREHTLAGMRDLRDWLAAIDQLGELQRVDGADWRLEIGGLSELNYRRRPPAAMLFDHIPGYPAGFRVLTGSLASARRIG